MQATTGTAGYHTSFGYRTSAEFTGPLLRVHGYTEPRLTSLQHTAVILAVSVVTACLKQPIAKLESFYFVTDVPGESNRIYASDKRAHFFRTLFSTRWFTGHSILLSTSEYVFLLSVFTTLRNALSLSANKTNKNRNTNTIRGFIAGGLTGVAYAAVRHPYDVLRATADVLEVPKQFRNAGDVLKTALREKPSVLLGIYRGFTAAACGRMVQYAAQFGVYNATRYDGVYHNNFLLFLYCHLGVFLGQLLQYPFMSLKYQLHLRNQATRRQTITYRSYIAEIRARHGITKIYDGFFTGRPVLNAVPAALLMTLYDMYTRRYTEYLHPELRKVHGEVDQPLCSVHTAPYAESLPKYQFGQK
ncbi:Mitochondrial substrate/solute carrier [Trypanosoma melophagium]|uniref:Mitochondrial substrate/solute carrier n=1 Tax=Trypanosoma melophagium TaxID=715481 RepID=UPI00351A2DB8|nr:Mitochondrial substrate/solute carrier [Trypanosoma melophagium]